MHYDSTNSPNPPWLINSGPISEMWVDPLTGSPLTAEYIWSIKDRNRLVQEAFKACRIKGFPYPILSDKELYTGYSKLCQLKVDDIMTTDNELKNSNSLGTDILKHFCGHEFYSSKGKGKNSRSCLDVFNNDDLLIKVLQNRMGYRTSKEDGTERPYVFSMSDSMLVQGMRSSGLAYTVSTFKPAIAKYIYQNYARQTVFDYSAGWGARALGAGSLGLSYYGFDPLTHEKVSNLINKFNIEGRVFGACSEDPGPYQKYIIDNGLGNTFDFAFSSPPYFDLESYSTDQTQSIVSYPDYDQWLDKFWSQTVSNCIQYVLKKKESSKFGVVIVEKLGKHDIMHDMVNVCTDLGLIKIDDVPFKTSKSHLSSKIKTKKTTKTTEHLVIFAC